MIVYAIEENGVLYGIKRSHAPKEFVSIIADNLAGRPLKLVDGVIVLDEDVEIARVQAEVDNKEAVAPLLKFEARYSAVSSILAQIAVLNESKALDIGAYLSDSNIQAVNSLITAISFQTAVNLLTVSDLSAYYTEQEKQSIIDLLQGHLDSEL